MRAHRRFPALYSRNRGNKRGKIPYFTPRPPLESGKRREEGPWEEGLSFPAPRNGGGARTAQRQYIHAKIGTKPRRGLAAPINAPTTGPKESAPPYVDIFRGHFPSSRAGTGSPGWDTRACEIIIWPLPRPWSPRTDPLAARDYPNAKGALRDLRAQGLQGPTAPHIASKCKRNASYGSPSPFCPLLFPVIVVLHRKARSAHLRRSALCNCRMH